MCWISVLEIIEEEIIPAVEAEQEDETEIGIPEFDEILTPEIPSSDILLAKKSTLESKLFTYILDELGYSYTTINTSDELYNALQTGKYKVALFDKELAGLSLKELSNSLKISNAETYFVMMIDPAQAEDENDALYVHEIIKNVINKDLLRLVFEKFI